MRWCLAVYIAALAAHAHAVDRTQICAKAESGKVYQVEATLISGQELIQRTNDLRYQPWATYVAIFWDQQHATLINIGGFSAPGPIPVDGTDMQGRHWLVSAGPICF